jgi:cbb3-type cytochrome oxidase cytochrome c subunit
LEGELLGSVCEWEKDLPPKAVQGARIFVSSGCTACHTYRGIGSHNAGGSNLTAVGLRRSRRFFERFVADPSRFGNDAMPRYDFAPYQLRQLAVFLAASKGKR